MKNSMAIAYNMKRKKMAEGGNVLDDSHKMDNEKGVHSNYGKGQSAAGANVRTAHEIKKDPEGEEQRASEHNEDPGNPKDSIRAAKREHHRVLGQMRSMKKPNLYANGGEVEGSPEMDVMQPKDDVPEPNMKSAAAIQKGATSGELPLHQLYQNLKDGLNMAMGGEVVDRIMRKKYSEGGMVANGGDDDLSKMADGMPNNFDDLALRDDLESSSDGSNNGDFLGNEQEAEDRSDILARIMKQRKMKQSNPRPA